MSRYRKTSASQYDKLVKEGRGQGSGKEYLPWLTVRDVPSTGLSTRVTGWKTGRVHHFLSKLELSFFYILEWSPNVTDIREQYPLPIDASLEIAERLRVKHPYVNQFNDHAVMTTDFLIDVVVDEQPKLLARSIKPESELASKRTLEKMMIEKTFWEERGIDFKVVTEREISKTLSENIDFIYSAKKLSDGPGVTIRMLSQVEAVLYQKLKTDSQPLAKSALEVDQQLGLQPGTCLWVIKHLIANRVWLVDMNVKIHPSKPIIFTRSKGTDMKERIAG